MELTCYLIDDEAHALDILTAYIERTPGLSLAGATTDPLAGLSTLTGPRPPDLTFLDIDMPELSGLALAGLAQGRTTIILTTAYREYGADAFEVEATDLLLKPIFYDRFLKSLQKAERARQSGLQPAAAGTVFVKTGSQGKLRGIRLADILYVSGALNYIEIHLTGEKQLTYLTLSEFQDRVPHSAFSRIHRSYLVNHAAIEAMDEARVWLSDRTILPVGRTYRQAFREKMDQARLISKRGQSR